jgi:cyclomaltodextrinase
MGMWGADDPDCRKPLWWEGMKFEPETRQNYQPGPKAYDPVGFNAEHFAYYQQLIRLRQTNPLLRSGEQEFLIADGNALAYRRYNKQNPKSQIVVAFNLGPGKLPFKLPNANRWTNLLTGKALNGASTELAPLSGIVLKQ